MPEAPAYSGMVIPKMPRLMVPQLRMGGSGWDTSMITGLTPSASNRAVFLPFVVEEQMTVSAIEWLCTTSSGNYDVGIYDATGNRLTSKGTTAVPGTGIVNGAFTAVTLTRGRYFAAICWDNTTVRFAGTNAGAAATSRVFEPFGLRQMSTAFPLPNPVTFADVAWTEIPIAAVIIDSVLGGGVPIGFPMSKLIPALNYPGRPIDPKVFSAAGSTVSASEAILIPVGVPEATTLSRILVAITNQSGNIDVGLYTLGGKLVVALGSTACPAAGIYYANVVDTPIQQGWYYIALAADNSTTQFANVSVGVAVNNAAGLWGLKKATAAFPLPATITPIALTAQQTWYGALEVA